MKKKILKIQQGEDKDQEEDFKRSPALATKNSSSVVKRKSKFQMNNIINE
jgi:hypothetical protein